MGKTTASLANVGKPPPRWFRIFKKIFINTENFVLGILLIVGYSSEAPVLLIIKLSTSFILTNIETLLANGEAYVQVEDQNKVDESAKNN